MLPWWWLNLGFSAGLYSKCLVRSVLPRIKSGCQASATSTVSHRQPYSLCCGFLHFPLPIYIWMDIWQFCKTLCLGAGMMRFSPHVFLGPVVPGVLHVTNRFVYTHNWRWIGQQAFEMISKHSWSFSNKLTYISLCATHKRSVELGLKLWKQLPSTHEWGPGFLLPWCCRNTESGILLMKNLGRAVKTLYLWAPFGVSFLNSDWNSGVYGFSLGPLHVAQVSHLCLRGFIYM